jgi:hypothetical protein
VFTAMLETLPAPIEAVPVALTLAGGGAMVTLGAVV